jgi:hypothetical protein
MASGLFSRLGAQTRQRVAAGSVVGAVVCAGVLAPPANGQRQSLADRASGARGVTYGGSTSAKDPIVIVLARDGKTVRRITTRFEATCTDGQGFVNFLDGAPNRTIDASGRFIAMSNVTDDLGSGVTRRRTASLNGKVNGKKITGSFRFHVDQVDAAGAVVATCDQTATFEAISARGRVFGGRTTQSAPVVIELAGKRNAVRRFRIGWRASCTPSGNFLHEGETLINFPLAGGRFGDDFTQNFFGPAGETQTSRYSLRGKLQRTRITGTLRVETTETDATGAQIANCDSGAISYTASSG